MSRALDKAGTKSNWRMSVRKHHPYGIQAVRNFRRFSDAVKKRK